MARVKASIKTERRDKLALQANVGHMCHPDLLRPLHYQIFDQIGKAPKAMLADAAYEPPWAGDAWSIQAGSSTGAPAIS
jgi:hypothetical protein